MQLIGRAVGADLADRIYEAAVLPEFWPSVLRDFAAAAESREAVMIATNGRSFKWVASSKLMEEATKASYEHPAGEDRTRRLLGLRRPGFVTDHDIYTEDEIIHGPLYTEYLIPNGFGRGIATAIELPHGDIIVFNAEGDYRLGRVSPAIIRQMDGLRPHLARSALISARLAFESARTAVETLAALGLAACAVKGAGTVLVANREFDRETALWTTRGGDRLALLDRRADRQLREALAAIGAEQGVRSLPLTAHDGGLPAVLHVVPIRRAAQDLFGLAMAILVLTKAGTAPTSKPLLQALFDLTPAEAEVATCIADGQTVGRIASASGKSIHTVRNQLKSILAKTGCDRQADLVRLLTQLVPRRCEST